MTLVYSDALYRIDRNERLCRFRQWIRRGRSGRDLACQEKRSRKRDTGRNTAPQALLFKHRQPRQCEPDGGCRSAACNCLRELPVAVLSTALPIWMSIGCTRSQDNYPAPLAQACRVSKLSLVHPLFPGMSTSNRLPSSTFSQASPGFMRVVETYVLRPSELTIRRKRTGNFPALDPESLAHSVVARRVRQPFSLADVALVKFPDHRLVALCDHDL